MRYTWDMEKGSILRIMNPVFVKNAPLVEAYIIRSQTEWFAMSKDAKEQLGQDWGEPPEMRFRDDAIEMWFPWSTLDEMWEAEVKICSIAVSMLMDAGGLAANAPTEQKMLCHSFTILRNITWDYQMDDVALRGERINPGLN